MVVYDSYVRDRYIALYMVVMWGLMYDGGEEVYL